MTFTYNDSEYHLPDGLADIPVSQYSSWAMDYGLTLDARYEAAKAIADEDARNLSLALVYIDRMTMALAFYSGIALTDVQQHIDIRQVLTYVGATELPVALQELPVVIAETYDWNGETWKLFAPSMADIVSYADFRTMLDLADKALALGRGDWSVMSVLCAAFLRHEDGEPNLIPDNVISGSAREMLMKTLPMSIALPTSYFISAAMGAFLATLESYIPET